MLLFVSIIQVDKSAENFSLLFENGDKLHEIRRFYGLKDIRRCRLGIGRVIYNSILCRYMYEVYVCSVWVDGLGFRW